MILTIYIIAIIIVVLYPIIGCIAIIYGLNNKYSNDEQMFSDSSKFTFSFSEEDASHLQ